MSTEHIQLLSQLRARRRLLLSLRTSGLFVGYDKESHLCWGQVCKAFALVPVEHADCLTTTQLSDMRARGIAQALTLVDMRPMSEVVADELLLIDTAYCCIREVGQLDGPSLTDPE